MVRLTRFSTKKAVFITIIVFNTIGFFLTVLASRAKFIRLRNVIEDGTKQNTNVEMKLKGFTQSVEMNLNEYTTQKIESSTDPMSTLLIAVNPADTDRLVSVWSFLECFVDKRIQTIVVAAPDWAKDENMLEPFLRHASETIPHLKHTQIVIRYYVHDRYDVGLWCDSLNDENSKIFNDHDDFILVNDSIMALQQYTGVLDLLQRGNLNMTSLTYSNKPEYWLESSYRGFSKDGMKKYMQHACKPANDPVWCSGLKSKTKKRRCITDYFEIAVAKLFPRQETAGIYSADVPDDMNIKQMWGRGSMWHYHWKYWYNELYTKQLFPIMKSDDPDFFKRAVNSEFSSHLKPEVLGACASHLDPKFLAPMTEKDERMIRLSDLILPDP